MAEIHVLSSSRLCAVLPLLLTDRWADWEASYAISQINDVEEYTVKTIARDKEAKISIGGMRAEIDYTMDEYTDFSQTALLLLPGGFAWQEEAHEDIADFVRAALAAGVTVAAICGATIFLGKHGFLNALPHTGDELECFTAHPGYQGEAFFLRKQVVDAGQIITAHETAAVEFAYTLFCRLGIDTQSELDIWRDAFQRGVFDRL